MLQEWFSHCLQFLFTDIWGSFSERKFAIYCKYVYLENEFISSLIVRIVLECMIDRQLYCNVYMILPIDFKKKLLLSMAYHLPEFIMILFNYVVVHITLYLPLYMLFFAFSYAFSMRFSPVTQIEIISALVSYRLSVYLFFLSLCSSFDLA